MALRSSSGTIPEGAIPLSPEEAVSYQWEQIKNWPNKRDVWPYRYGFSAQAVLSTMSALYINGKFRKFLKLRHQGFMASILPMAIVPPMFSVMLHCQVVSVDMILDRQECILCLQHRAAAVQIGCGMVYPLLVAPIANFMFANQHATYRVPYWSDIRSHFEIWLKVVKPLGKSLLAFACAHVLLAGFVTYSEYGSLYTIRKTLANKHKAFDENLTEQHFSE